MRYFKNFFEVLADSGSVTFHTRNPAAMSVLGNNLSASKTQIHIFSNSLTDPYWLPSESLVDGKIYATCGLGFIKGGTKINPLSTVS